MKFAFIAWEVGLLRRDGVPDARRGTQGLPCVQEAAKASASQARCKKLRPLSRERARADLGSSPRRWTFSVETVCRMARRGTQGLSCVQQGKACITPGLGRQQPKPERAKRDAKEDCGHFLAKARADLGSSPGRWAFSVETVCRMLSVAPSGFYACRKHPKPERAKRDAKKLRPAFSRKSANEVPFIAQEVAFSVETVCRVLGVARSGLLCVQGAAKASGS